MIRRTPLKRSTKPIRRSRTPISKFSKAKMAERRHYAVRARAFKEFNEYCQAKLEGCTVRTQDVHHVMGRGKYLLAETTWLAVCRHCHDTIHRNPSRARTLNLLQ